MYLPRAFHCDDQQRLLELIEAHPLATVVTGGALDAEYLPWVVRRDGARVFLAAHLPRVNPLSQLDGVEALLIFRGPAGYISPSWYPAKAEHGRVVPTWNYAAVHAFGRLRRIEERDWLRDQLIQLTTEQESTLPAPWSLADAPADYTERLLDALVGLEFEVERLQGKFKLSQNHPVANRAGAIAGLHGRGRYADAALAELMSSIEWQP